VKITVGPPFFNRVNAPLGIALLFLMGVGPIIAWRRSTAANLIRTFLWPTLFGVFSGLVAAVFGVRSMSAVLVISFSGFVLHTIVWEFHKGAMARMAMVGDSYGTALIRLFTKNQRRYGGYVIHLGVVFMFVGVTMSSVYRVEELHTVTPGESFSVGRYTLRYDGLRDESDDHMARLIATVTAYEDGKEIGPLEPEKRFYRKPEQPATEVAFRSTLRDDLYVILGSVDEGSDSATFQAYINPLVAWLWLGGIVLVLGTLLAIVPTRSARAREHARERAPVERQPSV
jgi:cytochrome c-type biogenesis protein CcmF